MRSTLPLSQFAAMLLVAVPAAAQADAVRTGKTFVVTLHALDAALANRLADDALSAAEALRPTLDKWGIKAARPPMLHVYVDTKVFREVERKTTKAPYLVEEFCSVDGGEAHVLVAPALPVESLQLLGLPPSTVASLQRCAGECLARQA